MRFKTFRLGRVLGLFVLYFLLFCPLAFAQPFSLEEVMSAPYPTGLTAAPEAERVAWVINEEGVRNIWTAAAPDFEPRKLTDYTEDDGRPLSGLAFTPDGEQLFYVRGSSPNRSSEVANPTSDPAGAEQALWTVSAEGETPRRLAEGHSPVVSLSGDLLVFGRGGDLYQLPLPISDTSSAGRLFEARGNTGSPVFSPDGERIAFVSGRDGHSFIGVFDRGTETIEWIAPGVDRDTHPVWSPDGEQIAFIRRPGRMKDELFNLTGGEPFAVWVADAATGEAQRRWASPRDDGGFAQYYPEAPLRWTETDRILFYSEHGGWLNVYALSPEGGTPENLTPGEAFVEGSAVSPDGQRLYFSSNHEDIDRRHLWRVPVAGGEAELLTPGEGVETDPVVLPGDEYLAYRGATARRPMTVTLARADGSDPELLSPQELPEGFPEEQLVVPEQVVFEADDGMEVHGQLFMPQDAQPDDLRPAVIFMHGGPIRQMLLGWHYSSYYANAYAMNQYLAANGYVVLSVNFRSGIGYGRDFRRAPDQGPRGASEYQDIQAAGHYLQELPEVDSSRIGLWGGSYGGYLTALGLARDPELFAAGVDLHGVHDWAFRAEDFSPGGGWGLQGEEMLEEAYASSPVADLDNWRGPVLLVHGDDDRNVLFAQTVDLVRRLRDRDVHVETLVFPDEVHGFLRHESWLQTFRAAADFFDRFLKESSEEAEDG